MRCPWRCLDFLRDLFVEKSDTMGAGASTHSTLTEEQKQLQDIESRLGHNLPLLRDAYERLSKTDDAHFITSSKLQHCFGIDAKRIQQFPDEKASGLGSILTRLGEAITSQVFKPENEQVTWHGFIKGYHDCCHQSTLSTRLNFFLTLFGNMANLEGDSRGFSFSRRDLRDFLWLCWLMMFYNKLASIMLPDLEFLVRGAFKSSSDTLSTQSLYSWIIGNIPTLANLLPDYLHACSLNFVEDSVRTRAFLELSGHLTPTRVWCLGLSQRDRLGQILLSGLFEDQLNPLYRSPLHGKGMNRFWSQVEGYKEAVLLLVSGMSPQESSAEPWLLAAVIPGGLANKNGFYGSSSTCIICLEPDFVVLHTTGKDKNYVYSHKAVPGGGYNSRPLPNGIGFGGTLSSERVWLDDEFANITFRHHAVDKSYQPGSLLPYQGYAPVTCQVLEVELWGLGGKSAEEQMATYQQREKIFAEQRRKVDLKAFGNWQDSPEKMMLGMVSDPNRAQREER